MTRPDVRLATSVLGTAVLQRIARSVRNETLQAFTSATSELLARQTADVSGNIVWLVGRAIWLQDHLCVQPLTGHSQLSSEWYANFGGQPPSDVDPRTWPPRQRLQATLHCQLTRLDQLLAKTPELRFSESVSDQPGSLTIGQQILRGLIEEAKCAAEIRVICQLGRTAGSGPSDYEESSRTFGNLRQTLS